jgi:hypothetical protein
MTIPRSAFCNRVATALLVAATLLAFRVLWPGAGARAEAQYAFVLTLGYGHLLGAAIVRRRGASRRPRGVSTGLWRAFCAISVATLFAAYFSVLDLFPASGFLIFASPLLAISVWHTVENDLAIARAYRHRLVLDPIARETQARSVGLSAFVLAPLLLVPGSEVAFAEVFSASVLYHLFQWLVFLRDRIALSDDAGRRTALLRGIAWAHVPMAVACAAVVGWRSSLPPLAYELVFSPSLYLFWSSLHVLQTSLARGITRAERPLRVAA